MLDRLPTEVLLLIAGHVALSMAFVMPNLVRVSRRLNHTLTPVLYKHIELGAYKQYVHLYHHLATQHPSALRDRIAQHARYMTLRLNIARNVSAAQYSVVGTILTNFAELLLSRCGHNVQGLSITYPAQAVPVPWNRMREYCPRLKLVIFKSYSSAWQPTYAKYSDELKQASELSHYFGSTGRPPLHSLVLTGSSCRGFSLDHWHLFSHTDPSIPLTDAQRLNVSQLRVLVFHVEYGNQVAAFPYMASIIAHASHHLRTLEIKLTSPTYINDLVQRALKEQLDAIAFPPGKHYPVLRQLELSGLRLLESDCISNILATRMPLLARLVLVDTWARSSSIIANALEGIATDGSTGSRPSLVKYLALDDKNKDYTIAFIERVWALAHIDKLFIAGINATTKAELYGRGWPPGTFSVDYGSLLRVRRGQLRRSTGISASSVNHPPA